MSMFGCLATTRWAGLGHPLLLWLLPHSERSCHRNRTTQIFHDLPYMCEKQSCLRITVCIRAMSQACAFRSPFSRILSAIEIFRQLTRRRIIFGVSDLNADPPKTLEEAKQKFRGFLRSQNYPEAICWLIPGDVLASAGPQYWVRKSGAGAEQYRANRYAQGVDRNLGILVEAVCATETETFASVFIPEDDADAQHRLMGPLLKLSCPVQRHSTTEVTNPLYWLWLRWRYGRQSDSLEVNQRG